MASRKSNSRRVVKLLDKVAVEAGLNKRVLHLEGETSFGTTKQKLDLPPKDDSDSHCHYHINYSIPKLDLRVSMSQSRRLVQTSSRVGKSISFVRSCSPLLDLKKSTRTKSVLCHAHTNVPITSSRLPVLEFPCSNATQFQIERIPSKSSKTCRRRYGGKRCNARTAKY